MTDELELESASLDRDGHPWSQYSKSRSTNTLISRLVERTGEADGRRVHRWGDRRAG